MRILNVSQNYFVAGGMDVVMFEQERILRERGIDVIPFAADDPQNRDTPFARYFPTAPRTEGGSARDLLRTLYSRNAAKAMERLLDDEQVDLVHLHSYFKRLTSAILPVIRKRGIPIVQTLHEYRAVCPVSTMFRAGRLCFQCRDRRYSHVIRHRCAGGSLAKSAWNAAEMWLSDVMGHKRDVERFFTISDFQRALLIEMGMDAERLVTLSNPIAMPPRETGRGAQEHVLFFGRLEPYKGVGEVIALARRLPGLRFVIAGTGSMQQEVQHQAAALPNLYFRGPLTGDALLREIDAAFVVLVPSLWPEAFGLTAAEAHMRSVPVVASNIGGLTETVRDSIDGFLIEPGEIEDFASALWRLGGDLDLAHTMGTAGLERARARYGADRFFDRLHAQYLDVIAASRRGQRGATDGRRRKDGY